MSLDGKADRFLEMNPLSLTPSSRRVKSCIISLMSPITTLSLLDYHQTLGKSNLQLLKLFQLTSFRGDYGLLTEKEVIMDPKSLDFDTAIVGLPIKQVVTIRNRKADLVFFAMSSTSIHFHCSFPQQAVSEISHVLVHNFIY